MQRVNDLLVGEHPRVRFLRGFDLPHQKLAQPSLADVAPDRRSRQRPAGQQAIIQSCGRAARSVTVADSRADRQGRQKKEKKEENNGDSFRASSLAAYRAATCNGRFPLPASVLATARSSLLKTAAISHWVTARESPLPSSTRSSSQSAIATGTGHAALPTMLCGKPPIRTVGLFIFVISMRDLLSFSLSPRRKTRKDFDDDHRDTLSSDNVDKHLAERISHASAYAATSKNII